MSGLSLEPPDAMMQDSEDDTRAAGCAGAGAPVGVLLVRGVVPQLQDTVEFNSDHLASRRVAELLSDNAGLAEILGVELPTEMSTTFVVDECSVLHTHVLLALHDWLEGASPSAASSSAPSSSAASSSAASSSSASSSAPSSSAASSSSASSSAASSSSSAASAPPSALQVSIIEKDMLNDWFNPVTKKRQEMLALPRVPSSSAAAAAAATSMLWTPLDVCDMLPSRADAASSPGALRASRVSYRYCRTLAEALTGAPLRVLFLPNLMWYSQFATQASLRQSLDQLLKGIADVQQQQLAAPRPVSVYPPASWDALLEQKNEVYTRFSDIMLLSQWLPVQDCTRHGFQELASRLCNKMPPGSYVLKASYADAARGTLCGIELPLDAARQKALAEAIRSMRNEVHASHFGLQQFCPLFRNNEFRHWCVAVPSSDGVLRFRIAVTMRTEFTNEEKLTGRVSAPLDEESAACYDLVQQLLRDDSLLVAELHRVGCRALRIDCGYQYKEKRAFLNELTCPTDAYIFTHAHETELIWKLGRIFGEDIAALMLH
jgi:hypothetical protein